MGFVSDACWNEWIANNAVANASVVVINKSLEALLLLRTNREWVLPSGGISSGESPEQAARRELLEETGIALDTPLKFISVCTFKDAKDLNGNPKTDVVITFLAKYDGVINIETKEALDFKWFSRHKIITTTNIKIATKHQILTAYENL